MEKNNNIATNVASSNQWLYNQFIKLPNRDHFTCPYLTIPTPEYCNAFIKVAVENRETNGWGQTEASNGSLNSIVDLINIYKSKVNVDWENLGSVWPMYYALREISEGDNTLDSLEGKVGFIHSNVALIGRKYGEKGYDPVIKGLLIQAQDRFLKASEADILLLGIGFGTKGHTENPYLEILEGTFLGKLIHTEKVEECDTPLYRLTFENSKDLIIFGYGHPQGLSYSSIVKYLTDFIINLLSNLNLPSK